MTLSGSTAADMQEINIRTVSPGKYFTELVYLDERFLLLSPETPLSEELRNRLLSWNFDRVYTDGEESDAPTTGSTGSAKGDAAVAGTLDQDIRENEELATASDIYVKLVNFAESTFSNFVASGEISYREVSDYIRGLIDSTKQHKQHLLRLTELPQTDKNYVVNHSAKTCLLAIVVGSSMKMPPHKLMELGSAALLHELGMIKLPPQIYMSTEELGEKEKKAITAHTILGFKILKGHSFPLNISLAVLECRERVNGTGYPRGLSADKISTPAKVISICSAYAALISERPYRAAWNPHNAMLELLKGRNVIYDETVLRHLVFNLSLFPLGTMVQMANGGRGIVVETDEENPRTPRVRLVYAPSGERYVEQPIVRTSEQEYAIVKAVERTDNRNSGEAQ